MKNCFEVFGFDFLMRRTHDVVVLEVRWCWVFKHRSMRGDGCVLGVAS